MVPDGVTSRHASDLREPLSDFKTAMALRGEDVSSILAERSGVS